MAGGLASLRKTHGGPSYLSRPALRRVGAEALSRVPGATEEEYVRLCCWLFEQLNDPYASYLPDAQLNAMRERFHGRVGLGMSVRRRLRREPGDSWRRGWRRVAAVTAVEDQSPAAAAGANAAAANDGGGASRAAVLARYAGFYKCVQSVGAACAWGIDSAGAKASAQFNLNVALAAVCVLPTLWVARQLPASAAANDAVADEEGADAPLTSPTSPGDLELARL